MRITENEKGSEGSDDGRYEGLDAESVRSDREFEFYLASSQVLLDEIRDQHGEALGSVNSLIQRSGIIMAFNSVFLIELFNLQSTGGILWMATVISTLIGMSFGLFVVIEGRLMPAGTNIDKVVWTYNGGAYGNLVPEISNGRLRALKESISIAELISNMVLMQTIFLLVSVTGLIIMEV